MGIERRRNSTHVNTRFRWPVKVNGSAQCDRSGFIIKKTDQARQMEYDGQGLYYTGKLVLTKFLDIPQQQNLKPKIYKDPTPIRDARSINPPIPTTN